MSNAAEKFTEVALANPELCAAATYTGSDPNKAAESIDAAEKLYDISFPGWEECVAMSDAELSCPEIGIIPRQI